MRVHIIKRERRLKAQAPLLLCYSRAHACMWYVGFVCNHATLPVVEKLWSKGSTWAELFEMNEEIWKGFNFIIDNNCQLFFDAQVALNMNEFTVVR